MANPNFELGRPRRHSPKARTRFHVRPAMTGLGGIWRPGFARRPHSKTPKGPAGRAIADDPWRNQGVECLSWPTTHRDLSPRDTRASKEKPTALPCWEHGVDRLVPPTAAVRHVIGDARHFTRRQPQQMQGMLAAWRISAGRFDVRQPPWDADGWPRADLTPALWGLLRK